MKIALLSLVGVALSLGSAVSISGAAQELIFGPREPRAEVTGIKGDPDWPFFFSSDAPWQKAAKQIRAFDLEAGYISDATDVELTTTAAQLEARGISILVPLQSVAVNHDEPCGKAEGYDNLEHIVFLAKKLRRLGILPKYLNLDGPLEFGHYGKSPQECRFSIEEVAERTAKSVLVFRAEFPKLIISDTEGGALPLRPKWAEDYKAFKTALEKRMDQRLDALILDVNWRSPGWPQAAMQVAAMAKSLGMRFGMIYNGDDRDESNSAWLAHAKRNFTVLESEYGIVPDIASFNTWNKFPTHALPETSPEAHLWLINEYVLPRTRFDFQRRVLDWEVNLMDETGRRLAGQRVIVDRLGLAPSDTPPVRILNGTVPSNAASALIALRVNAECNCVGANDLLIGAITYSEGGKRQRSLNIADLVAKPRGDRVVLETVAAYPNPVTRVWVPADEIFLYTSSTFLVTPGANYEFRAQIGSVNPDGLFGFVKLLWIDSDAKAMFGPMLFDEGDRQREMTVLTDRDGRLSIPISARARELYFAGTTELRPALTKLEPTIK